MPAKPWCDWSVLGKAAQKGYRIILEPEVEDGAPVAQMGYADLSTEGELTKQACNALASTLVTVHVGAGFQLSAAC